MTNAGVVAIVEVIINTVLWYNRDVLTAEGDRDKSLCTMNFYPCYSPHINKEALYYEYYQPNWERDFFCFD